MIEFSRRQVVAGAATLWVLSAGPPGGRAMAQGAGALEQARAAVVAQVERIGRLAADRTLERGARTLACQFEAATPVLLTAPADGRDFRFHAEIAQDGLASVGLVSDDEARPALAEAFAALITLVELRAGMPAV